MKSNRFLATTTAMSIVLGSLQPMPGFAQSEGGAAEPCVEAEGRTCPPAPEGTEQPAAEAPAEPVADAPAVETPAEPVADAPAAETPAEPVAEAPAAEAPVEPVAEAPAAEAPAAEAPVEPVAEAPAAEAPAAPVAEAPAAETPAEQPIADAPAVEAPAAPVAEAAPTPAEPAVTAEGLAQQLLNRVEGTAPSGETAAPDTDIPLNNNETAPNPVELVAPTPEPEAPIAAAAADDNGRSTGETAQVTDTVVTEENSRSSAEEFQTSTQGNAAAPQASSKKGLSNFEKFALGAVGVVALGVIIGKNREVVSNSGDRVILRDQNGDLEVLRDDDTLLRRPGSEVRTETFSDGSTRSTVTRRDGSRIVTIADAAGRVIKRTRIESDGYETLLIDDTEVSRPVDVSRLPAPSLHRTFIESNDRTALEAALRAKTNPRIDRLYTLRQVRQYREVRDLMPEISIDAINFESGSAAIQPEEAEELLDLGQALSEFIADNPDELFLVEGHTDAKGGDAINLALSDRRAESVALALTEYFGVPPENLIIQGYGESELLIETQDAERANRRAVVRRITPLLR